jgi:site-specific DNA-methyltransferase (adenine-specific)
MTNAANDNTVAPTATIHLGDCLDVMRTMANGSVDAVVADLPYQITRCPWDVIIPFKPLWAEYRRVVKPKGAIVLTATDPFTSLLVTSNLTEFKHKWVWVKNKATGFQNAKRAPRRNVEDVLVFGNGKGQVCYNPQGLKPYGKTCYNRVSANTVALFGVGSGMSRKVDRRTETYVQEWTNYPTQILEFSKEHKSLHPTQKPVALLEYLIRTYSNPGDTILDNTMGSGSTGVAALNTGRNFVGIERDPKYFATSEERIMGYKAAA